MGKECFGRQTVALIRLHVIVEGQTEEGFVNEVLAPALGGRNIFIYAHSITTARSLRRLTRGGWSSYGQLQRDLTRWMKQDQNPDARFTTMVDLYGLPEDFPGHSECKGIAEPTRRVEYLEEQFARDIVAKMGDKSARRRFLPHIQPHEFEALLFSDPSKFMDIFPDQHGAVQTLLAIRAQYRSPEDIDDGESTAPSKRILQVLRGYAKPVSGLLVAQRIGLTVMRRECPHFDAWIESILQFAPD
jgi:hypothetical protein